MLSLETWPRHVRAIKKPSYIAGTSLAVPNMPFCHTSWWLEEINSDTVDINISMVAWYNTYINSTKIEPLGHEVTLD